MFFPFLFLFFIQGKLGGVERGETVVRRYDMREESLFNKGKKKNSTDVKWGRKRSQWQIVPSSTETKRNINYIVLWCSRFYCARMGRESHIRFLGVSGYCSEPHGRIRHTAREQVHKVVMETRMQRTFAENFQSRLIQQNQLHLLSHTPVCPDAGCILWVLWPAVLE